MIKICIKDIVILLDLKYESSFKNLYKYETKEKNEYYIKTISTKPDYSNAILFKETKFYNLYKCDDLIIQNQHDIDGNYVGDIVYNGNYIYLYMNNESFQLEYLLSQYALTYIIKQDHDCLFMHGSSILYKDTAIIFTAKSGTGKSTHVRLWKKLSDSVSINDDKNIIRLVDDELYVYSSPWSGKHQLDNNIFAKLKAIVFIYQNKENKIEEISKAKAMRLLLSQIENLDSDNTEIWNKITDKMLSLNLYYYGCNMDDEAFYVINKRIDGDIYE